MHVYDARILDALAGHGVRPAPTTAPARAREVVNDLYRYELRRLRDRLLRGEIPKPDYAGHVVALRRRYWVLSIPVQQWAKSCRRSASEGSR
jgi:hypothetical protein